MKDNEILNGAEKTAKTWVDLAKANTESAFNLGEQALAIRDIEGVKKFWADSFTASREGVERFVKTTQDAFAEQSALVKKSVKAGK